MNLNYMNTPISTTRPDLFECARTGEYPPGITASDLAMIKSGGDGWTALHEAAKSGHLPPGTKTTDLMGVRTKSEWTPLREAAIRGVYPDDITAIAMAATSNSWGWTALHTAAGANHLPPGTTLYDLVDHADAGNDTPYDCLPDEMDRSQLKGLLDEARATTLDEVKFHGDLLFRKSPAFVTLWMAGEIKRINNLAWKRFCQAY